MSVSLPLVGRESLKLVKVDDLWAVDNDDDDVDAVVKCADESGSFLFLQYVSRFLFYLQF